MISPAISVLNRCFVYFTLFRVTFFDLELVFRLFYCLVSAYDDKIMLITGVSFGSICN